MPEKPEQKPRKRGRIRRIGIPTLVILYQEDLDKLDGMLGQAAGVGYPRISRSAAVRYCIHDSDRETFNPHYLVQEEKRRLDLNRSQKRD